VIAGSEDNSYEIVNSTVPCLEDRLEIGVLGRVVSELLSINESFNQVSDTSPYPHYFYYSITLFTTYTHCIWQ
jgi:hypothetical protein